MGYWLAKLFKANGQASQYYLFGFGLAIGLIESSLFYFDWLTNSQGGVGTFIVFVLFFIVAFISIGGDSADKNLGSVDKTIA